MKKLGSMRRRAALVFFVLLFQIFLFAFAGCEDKKKELSNVELAALGQKAAVTIEVTTVFKDEKGDPAISRGSGFFIDGNGTLMTAFHVIEGATNIEVIAGNGARLPLEKVISFNPVYDIAIIKIDYESVDYLKVCEEKVLVGESVVAVGSALGSLAGTCTYGYVSSVNRKVGKIECIQTDAAISSGNSGGPLLNVYGEVVGMNCFSYVNGENLNLAVKVAMFEKIGADRNYDMSEMMRWFNTEASRSYSPYDENYDCYYSIVNNYDTVTGIQCTECIGFDDQSRNGYYDTMKEYKYVYDRGSYDKYVEYLLGQGFVYTNTELVSATIKTDTYVNEKDDYQMTLSVDQAKLELTISMQLR